MRWLAKDEWPIPKRPVRAAVISVSNRVGLWLGFAAVGYAVVLGALGWKGHFLSEARRMSVKRTE